MNITDLITQLIAIRAEHGDLEVVVDTEWAWGEPGLTLESIADDRDRRTALVIR